jgi:hypothetical protein
MTPAPLSKMRCARHAEREAAACCAACGIAFCRECVSEHEGRFLCAACLGKIAPGANAGGDGADAARPRGWPLAALKRAPAIAVGAAWLWLCFYLAGLLVEKIPQSAHEGTVWKQAAEAADDAEWGDAE